MSDDKKQVDFASTWEKLTNRPTGASYAYGPIRVTAGQLRQSERFADLLSAEMDRAIERQLKWLVSPIAFVGVDFAAPSDDRVDALAYMRAAMLPAPRCACGEDHPPSTPVVADPLDAVVQPGKATLRSLLAADEAMRREGAVAFPFSPEQRAAVSAHWSAELRRKVAASAERDRNRVLVDLQDEP
jgi:hypothetical protein